ncbi:hypothetical protein [Mucilaginibacter glaciei]|uniref:Uncharacterized protein n=1 Tax=Mucilaginibacter glaciei TaxID=2772109 RepID=A0A926RZK6_9SPHI|nr:hypothetical protein [Mucilaginibacter glaciei]MBD1391960.1 hypothetical protein [Mucilaginibacter glaciei]
MDNKQIVDEVALLEMKADELVALLQKGIVGKDKTRAIQERVYHALDNETVPQAIGAFTELDAVDDRLELLNEFEFLLSHHKLDSATTSTYLSQERLKKGVIVAIGIIMITLGMAMIIMPAPPYFEMFTIFHFNQNDGVTLMDLIALLIVFTGVYLFLSSVLKKQSV